MMNARRNNKIDVSGPRAARGITLIEILVTLVILAFGVMGMAAMQTATYKQLQTSHNFTHASVLAGEMADRMLANPVQSLADAYDHAAAPNAPKDCAAETCSTAEIAAYDIAQWQARVTGNPVGDVRTPGSLPAGTGAVARVAGTDDFNVIVRWDDDLSGSSGTDCAALDPNTVADPNDLDCYVLMVSF